MSEEQCVRGEPEIHAHFEKSECRASACKAASSVQVIGGSALRVSWGKNNSRPYTQQPAAASSIPYYPGTYIPSVPMPAYPAYPPADPYAGYHVLGQPGTSPYLMQAILPEME